MNLDSAFHYLQTRLDARHDLLVTVLNEIYPDRTIERFSVLHTTGVGSFGVRASWKQEGPRFVEFMISLSERKGDQEMRGFVYWAQLEDPDLIHDTREGMTEHYERFSKESLEMLARESKALEQLFVDALHRGEPLEPSD